MLGREFFLCSFLCNLKNKLDKSKLCRYTTGMNDRNWGGRRDGAGRKATGRNKVNITLTLTKNEAELLKRQAEESGLSVSRFIAERLHLGILPENLTGGRRLC